MDEIPEDHPRYQSLVTRHRIEEGVDLGITSRQGLIAEGRGEAFDYLLGEQTIPSADAAARTAAALLLLADHPVLSINGNVAALVPGAMVDLGEVVGADLEINIFGHTDERMRAIAQHLEEHGATNIKGLDPDAQIPGISHARGAISANGIYDADVVLVPLEDGDRAEALIEMGKQLIVIDLNPLARSARAATIPVIDNIVRALPNIVTHAESLRTEPSDELTRLVTAFSKAEALGDAERAIRRGL